MVGDPPESPHPPGQAVWERRRQLAVDESGHLYNPYLREVLSRAACGQDPMRRQEALIALHTAANLAETVIDRVSEAHGLSRSRLMVLGQLHSMPEHQMPLGELAQRLNVSARNVTSLIDLLERDGLVERIHDRADRRLVYARLTEPGLAKIEATRPVVAEIRDRLTHDLTEAELAQLRHLCYRVVQNIQELKARGGWQNCPRDENPEEEPR